MIQKSGEDSEYQEEEDNSDEDKSKEEYEISNDKLSIEEYNSDKTEHESKNIPILLIREDYDSSSDESNYEI